MIGQARLGEHEQGLDALPSGHGDDGQEETDGDVGKARLVLGAEVFIAEGHGGLPEPILGAHGEAGHFGNGAPGLACRVDDAAVDGGGTGALERQRIVRVFRAGQHQAVATRQGLRCAGGAQQAVQAVAVVFVGFAAVGANRLETQLFAIHLMANAEHGIAGFLVERRGNLEVILEAFAQTNRY